MFPFTEKGLEFFFMQTIYHVGGKLDLDKNNPISSFEMDQLIQQDYPEIAEKLTGFFKAYREWHKYNFDEDGIGIKEFPDQDEAQRLMSARDTTRHDLIKALEN